MSEVTGHVLTVVDERTVECVCGEGRGWLDLASPPTLSQAMGWFKGHVSEAERIEASDLIDQFIKVNAPTDETYQQVSAALARLRGK